ncbi:MAG: asparagine synthase B [Bacteroidales bacterium]
MCGIVTIFEIKQMNKEWRDKALDMSRKIRHRGPDWSGIYNGEHAILSHERLAIVDPLSGKQPFISPDGKIILAVNGEIYNHRELREKYKDSYEFQTKSDCEVIIPLFLDKGVNCVEELSGIFAFSIYDVENDSYFTARDQMGVIPLYIGEDEDGTTYFASELKALEGYCETYQVFPPGNYYDSNKKTFTKWYHKDWRYYANIKDNASDEEELRTSLETAVKKQLMSDVPYGVLLSGGLDSSLISAITQKYAKKRIESDDTDTAWWPRLHSFAIGLKGSPDLLKAKEVADAIGTVHHEVTFTIQEGIDALKDVIYHIETYDITTVRASTPMFLLARYIKSMGIKMVLSGEGADEIFGGYLYFHKAPDAKSFHEETVRKLDRLYMYDCLRANKALAAWGIEGRVPFLDKEFMDTAMSLNPKDKMCPGDKMEKYILRHTFDASTKHEAILPKDILWRQKEQFSDGVGYSWIDSLKEYTENQISDNMMKHAKQKFPINTPQNKEEYFYRSIFEEHFPSNSAALTVPSIPSVACSSEVALDWDEKFKAMNEPSGRAIANHNEAYKA